MMGPQHRLTIEDGTPYHRGSNVAVVTFTRGVLVFRYAIGVVGDYVEITG